MIALWLTACVCSGRGRDSDPVDSEGTPQESGSPETGETGPAETGETADTGDVPEWTTLPQVDCQAPDGLPDDPLVLSGQLQITQGPNSPFFVELVDLEVDGDTVYGVGQGGLIVYDVSTPTSPVKQSVFPSEQAKDRFHRVEVLAPGVVALTHRDRGLRVVRLSDHADLLLHTERMEGLAAVGDRLYVSSRDRGLVVYDISDLEDIQEIGAVQGLGHTWELAATDDGWLYAADNQLGLVPFDLSDPDAPVMGTPVAVQGSALHVRSEGEVLLLSNGAYGVAVYERADPAAPTLAARLETGGSVVMADAADGLLWAVDHEAVTVWDFSQPTAPTPLHRETTEQFALAVVAGAPNGGRGAAWVGDWSILGWWTAEPQGQAARLELAADRAYVTDRRVLDLRNHGAAPGTVIGWSAPVEGLSVELSSTTLAPGEVGRVRVSWSGDGTYEIPLCLVVTDPQDPTQELLVLTGDTPGAIGDPAPEISLQGLDGEIYTLSEQRGHPVVLAYFATW